MSDGWENDNVHVAGGARLLTPLICEGLHRDVKVYSLVQKMREREGEIAQRLEAIEPAEQRRACLRSIASLVPESGLGKLADVASAAAFAQAVFNLPRTLSNAPQRKAAREIARAYALFSGQGITVPRCADDFHGLWELAMAGEPRWLDGYPTSAFRTQASKVIASPFTQEVKQINTHHTNIVSELDELTAFLADCGIAPEARAACGFLSLEFTHPFADGNGHVGRLLLLSMLQGLHSPESLAFLSRELVLGRAKASHQFSLVRSREHDVREFCLAMLTYLLEALAERALETAKYG